MKFRNPRGDTFIEGRIPTEEDNFYDDRFYTDIDNVFVRLDPHEGYVKVIFPCSSEVVLRYSYDSLSKLSKTNPSLKEFISAADNIEDVSDIPLDGYIHFDDDFKWFIKLKK